MRKLFFALTLFIGLTSFGIHKFFVSIYQINYNQKEKRIEITSRIFVDDLNAVLYKKYKQKTHLGEKTETAEDLVLMQKYLNENFKISINNQPQSLNYLSNEMEGHSLICYFNIKKINSLKSIEITNTALFEISTEQQNIIQTKLNGKKESTTLTTNKSNLVLKFE